MGTQLERVDRNKIVPPKKPVGPGEEVVGSIANNLELQRFYGLRDVLGEDINKLRAEALNLLADGLRKAAESEGDNKHDKTTCPRCQMDRRIQLLALQAKLTSDYFWTALRFELDQAGQEKTVEDGNDIGIRENWQIVVIPGTRLNELAQLMAMAGILPPI